MSIVEYFVWGLLMLLVVGFFIAAFAKSRPAFGVLALVAMLGAAVYPAAIKPLPVSMVSAESKPVAKVTKQKEQPQKSMLEQLVMGVLGGSAE